jgi:DAPG hydrolase PhiG domain
MTHVARDTPYGCVLRSRFWLGAGLGGSPEELRALFPDEVGLELMKHAYSEFFYLSRFLPSLYIAEQRESEPAPLPW